MDTRSLIALGMLLLVAVVALLKGAMAGADVKDVILLLGGGVIGAVVPQRRGQLDSPPAIPVKPGGTPSPGLLGLIICAALLLVSCSSVDTWERHLCSSGVSALHADGELVCDDARGVPFASRPWAPDDTPDTACAFCEGFIQGADR